MKMFGIFLRVVQTFQVLKTWKVFLLIFNHLQKKHPYKSKFEF
ncbi:hypothetical protein CLV31_106196 [Algoriphagus aquaeductus]|uniref:Uncharacterized protein n=1 Tax=Algoriphagus aquaeductus TaxID=475299 RepID=A0A326RQL3_9BACT|nr:hypothetical protein CLV31_106196 [Algoriphagus aquaeductus]